MKSKIVASVLLAAFLAGVGFYFYNKVVTQNIEPIATTTTQVAHCDNDARLCPDGSTVLRSGAQCEFAACPSMFGEVRDWQNRKDPKSDISFKYPTELGSQYVTARDWPPTVTNVGKSFACAIDESAEAMSGYKAEQTSYSGQPYCVWSRTEGAAGSTYTEYQITTQRDGDYFTFHFVVQTPQCLNYVDSEQSVCQAAQKAFNVLELVAEMAATIKL